MSSGKISSHRQTVTGEEVKVIKLSTPYKVTIIGLTIPLSTIG